MVQGGYQQLDLFMPDSQLAHQYKEAQILKVFIADDSDLMRDRLALMIGEMESIELIGHAPTARQAIDQILQLKPDLAILDIRMPDGDGIQVLKSIKAQTTKPIVIMLTAFPSSIHRRKCIEAGAEFFFDKATEFDQVALVIKGYQTARSRIAFLSKATPDLPGEAKCPLSKLQKPGSLHHTVS